MKLALFVCLMFSTAILCEGPFPQFWLNFFMKWIPINTDVDVMMLLDSSTSVTPGGFNLGKQGIKITNRMIDFRTPSGINGLLSGTRSGYIQFASIGATQIVFNLPAFNNAAALNNAIGGQIYTLGWTAIAKALNLSGVEFFENNPNPGQPLRVLLVTDGRNNQPGDPIQEADLLKDKGVEICVVAIGTKVNFPVLKAISTEYPFGPNQKMIPCVGRAKSWRQFKNGVKRAFKLLRKEARKRG